MYGLQLFLFGYVACLRRNSVTDSLGLEFLTRFAGFLRQQKRWSLSTGPVQAILYNVGAEAWDTFFDLVDEFEKSAGDESEPGQST